jgi:hypothetical protein
MQALYAERRYAECRYAECRVAVLCWYSDATSNPIVQELRMRIDLFLQKRNVFNFFSSVSANLKEVRLNLRY